MPLATGQMLNNRYRIVKLLGQGGFGAVYKAWDINLERPMALKENLDASPVAQRQFKREAQILFDLSHPNLPKVIDHFSIPGQGQYLVMEYVEGEDLGTMLEQAGGALLERQVLEWVIQVCDALSYLHSQQQPIIHRDIKPANIKITPHGKAVLVDFGIAKVYDAQLSTTAGTRAVTPGYSPQEQYGMGTTDARTDVYALGATLYHLLTGVRPPESIQRNLDAALPPPCSLNAAVSAHVEAAVQTAMAMHPSQRFQSTKDFKTALAAPVQTVSAPIPKTQVAPGAAPVGSIGQVPPAQIGKISPPLAGQTPSVPALPWKWLAGAVGLLVVGALTAGGIISALSGGSDERRATPSAAALATQSRRTQLAAELAATQTIGAAAAVETGTQVAIQTATRGAVAASQAALVRTPSPTPTPEASATPTGLPPSITDSKGVRMNLIPAGSFQIGSESGSSDEKPVHEVYLDAFYIDVYEVTNQLYAACVASGVCRAPSSSKSYTHDSYYGNSQYVQYPVINVTWDDAVEFCAWRGARLPTEAEWEKAARGGLEGKTYPWGDDDPDCSRANSYNNATKKHCVGDSSQVGSYVPNGYGLYDMAGNVWEWVQDWYDDSYYSSQSVWNNPTGPDSGSFRVLRGGSWDFDWSSLRSAYRTSGDSDFRGGSYGFRCGAAAVLGKFIEGQVR